MRCPRHEAEHLRARIHHTFPHLRKAARRSADPSVPRVDTTPLLEAPLDSDATRTADIVIRNALVLDDGSESVCDIAIRKNVITKIGDTGSVSPLIGDGTTVYNAEGNSVVPGWTDSHLHLTVAMLRLKSCDLEGVENTKGLRTKLKAYAEERADASLLTCFGLHYADPPIIPSDHCRTYLDDIVADRPLLIYAHDLHTCWANTKALEEAGLLHPMPPYPPMIEALHLDHNIILGADGLPSGEFREPEVIHFLSGPLTARFATPLEQQVEDLKTVCRQLARLGITTVHRMALAEPAQDIAFLLLALELEQRGELPIRINTSCGAVADSNMLEDVLRAARVRDALMKARRRKLGAAELHEELVGLLDKAGEARHAPIAQLAQDEAHRQRYPIIDEIHACSKQIRDTVRKTFVHPHLQRENPHRREQMPRFVDVDCKVRCDTIKIFMDGVVEKRTAYRLDEAPPQGVPEFSQEELDSLVALADGLGMQVAAHCVGDGSVRSMLDAIARARRSNARVDQARGHRIPHRVEHIEMCHPEDIPRFGTERIVASMQPLHERPPVTLWHELVPHDEWSSAFAWKELLSSGAVLVFGSDWPIVSCDVREGVHHAVRRRPWTEGDADQHVTLEQALSAYTTAAAWTEYASARKGKIQPGMLADLVVLSGDVRELAAEPPAPVEVRLTVCDGRVVYDASKDKDA